MTQRIKLIVALLVMGLLVVGCDRLGRAPADLDITPIPTATPLPTATPTPAPTPEGGAEVEVVELTETQVRLDAILEEIPGTVTAGAVQWKRDKSPNSGESIEALPRIENGVGFKVFFSEQIGGKANISYAVFNTPEDAQAHYEFIKGLRTVLENGKPDTTLPEPNLLGAGLYGSVGIFQRDQYFVEVSVEAFSSTSGNPLVSLSRQAIAILEAGIASFDTPDQKTARIAALQALIPDQLTTGEVNWFRERAEVTLLESDFEDGLGISTRYQSDEGSTASVTFVVFESAEGMTAAYTRQLTRPASEELSFSLSQGAAADTLPAPNTYQSSSLRGERALIQVSDIYFVDIALFSESGAEVLPALANALVALVTDSVSTFESSAP